MAKRYEGKKLARPAVLRAVVMGVFMVAVVASIIFHTGWGSVSAFGIGNMYALCPLGALEAMLGSRSVVAHGLIAVAVVVALALLVGKAFCAWGCPAGLLARFLRGKGGREEAKQEQAACARQALDGFRAMRAGCAGCAGSCAGATDTAEKPQARKRTKVDSRHFVLAGTLGSALIFGFPVFCLVCPIGLSIATIVALVQLVGFNQPSIGLVLFPLIIVVELLVLRKWCHTLCPVSALMSLLSSFNRTLRPQVDSSKCLRYVHGEPCSACSSACPELIDPHSDLGPRPMTECTRCGACAEACPQGAISFTRRARRAPEALDDPVAEQV